MQRGAKAWAFRIVTAILVPVVLLLAAEGALRLIGYGHSSAFTEPCTVNGRQAHCDNDRFTWQFFPPGAFRLPLTFAIPDDKPPQTFRIFVVGESAAQGAPEPAYSFARYLEVMLRERFPAARFEVFNTAITAVNSHVLLPLVRDLSARDGDLFVIYTGNNEVVGPFGAGTTLTPRGMPLPLVRASVQLRSTRVGQLMGAALQAGDHSGGGWQGMEMFLKQQVAADDPAMAQVYVNFERNLRDIVDAARGSGARVVLSTVGVNLKDSPPFASLHRADLAADKLAAWDAKVGEGAAHAEAGRNGEALQSYHAAAAIDDRYAELHFRIARAHWAVGDFAAAQKSFVEARELDALRFRADARINAIIRAVAGSAGPGVDFIDGEARLAAASEQGVPGAELFWEHVHLTPRGNYLLARELFPGVVAALPEAIRGAAASPEPLSQEESERLLALTDFDKRRVTGLAASWVTQPPFTNQLDYKQRVQTLQQAARGQTDFVATAAVYRAAIAKSPEDRWLHFNFGVLLKDQEPAAAMAEFRRALDLNAQDYAARQELCEALIRTGSFEDGIAECRTILAAKPYHAPAHFAIAVALSHLQRFDDAIGAYEQAMRFHPGYTFIANRTIGLMRLQQQKYEQAAESLRKAVDAGQGAQDADLLYGLSQALQQLGRHDEADQAMRSAMALRQAAESQSRSPQSASP